MAYVGSVNNVNTQGAAAYFNAIKTALLAAGWELMASSDGTTYTAGSTPDRVPNVTAWNNNSAWCRLREPGGAGGREYVFMRGTGANSVAGVMKYSRSTGFVGGSPNATTMPTTGASGDGVVWFSNGSLGYGAGPGPTNDLATTTAASASNLAVASGYVSCVASNTALNGVYGWWMISTASGTGAINSVFITESVQAGTFPVEDQDPSYRMASNQVFFSGYSFQGALGLPQFWQCYGMFNKTGQEFYVTASAQLSYFCTINTAQNAATLVIPRTNLGFGYSNVIQTFPVMVGTINAFQTPYTYPKGFTTGFGCFNVAVAQLDTINLATAEPRVVINNTYGFCIPWVTGVAPIY